MSTASTSTHRRRFLGSHFDQMSGFLRIPASRPRPTSIPFGSGTLPVDSWEWEALVEWARPGSRESWCALVAEALALDAKARADIERAQSPDSSATVRLAAEEDLHLDSVFAYRLLAETQRAVEAMVLQGRMDQAKKLTQFRRRLQTTTSLIGTVIGEAGLAEAEAIAALQGTPGAAVRAVPKEPNGEATDLQSLLALEDALERRESSLDEEPRSSTDAAAIGTIQKKPRISARAALVAFLLASILAWCLFVAWPLATREVLPSFDTKDFQELPAVRSVVARPPSLYVTVGSASWKGLPESERHQVVEGVATLIAPAGYTGAHFKDESGATVAQWFKATGVRLVSSRTPPS